MRFLPIAFAVGGALAAVQPDQPNQADQGEEQTLTVTEYTTYCPSATMSQVPQFTTSAGQTFSLSRPLITTTVTHCDKCSSSTPAPSPSAPSVIPVQVPSANPNPTPSSSSIVLGPSSVDAVRPSGSVSGSASGSASSPSNPVFTGGASRAASAGVGLSGVLGVVAFLL